MKFLLLAGAAILFGTSIVTTAAPSATRSHEFLTAPAQRRAAFLPDLSAVGVPAPAGLPAALPPPSPVKPVVGPAEVAPAPPVLDSCSGGGQPARGCPPG